MARGGLLLLSFASARTHDERAQGGSLAGVKVLIVDDSAPVRKRLAELMAEAVAIEAIAEAESAAAALEALPRIRPDVVILDLQMPEGSGLDVLRHIRRAGPSPLVVVLTNHTEDHYRRASLDSGADFFFDKSRELHRVLEVLSALRPA
jgi:DNA-binding NarL/FixJ family response regulator